MMASKLCLTLSCFAFTIVLVSGAPKITDRRSARDLDKIDGLRAKLYQLQKRIHQLEAEEQGHRAAGADREAEAEVSSELHDVSRMRDGMESQMTSRRQKQELAETLNDLLRETSERGGDGNTNSAGEYLGGKYNSYAGREHELGEQLSAEKHDHDHSVKRDQTEEAEEEEEEERLRSIYDIVQRLYSRQEQDGESGPTHFDLLSDRESTRHSDPGFETEEGTFGDFVDTEEDSRPSVLPRSRYDMRKSVLSAIENRLLDDLKDARNVGISVDDLIHDVQNKAQEGRSEKLREIERDLNKLSERGE